MIFFRTSTTQNLMRKPPEEKNPMSPRGGRHKKSATDRMHYDVCCTSTSALLPTGTLTPQWALRLGTHLRLTRCRNTISPPQEPQEGHLAPCSHFLYIRTIWNTRSAAIRQLVIVQIRSERVYFIRYRRGIFFFFLEKYTRLKQLQVTKKNPPTMYGRVSNITPNETKIAERSTHEIVKYSKHFYQTCAGLQGCEP